MPTNPPGLEQTVAWVLPAQQRLHRDHLPRAQIELGLVVQQQLVTTQRAVQVVLTIDPGHHLVAQRIVEEAHLPTAGALRAVHGGVGLAEQLTPIAMPADQRDTHARRDPQLARADHEGIDQRGEQRFGPARRGLGRGRRR